MRIKAIFNETDPRQKSYIKYLKRTFPEVIDEKNPEMFYVIGGDGALLHAHTNNSGAGIPYFGKGFGTLNFVMNNFENDFEVLDGLLTDEIKPQIIETVAIKVKIEKKNGKKIKKVAINDVVIGDNIMDWHEFIINSERGAFKNLYLKGTGLCLSTPLGSTAYNINNGGKVLPLDSDMWSITGVACDHRINELMMPQNIDITINSNRHKPIIYIDGVANAIKLEKGDHISFRKHTKKFKLAFLEPTEFFQKRMKLIQKKR
jgi:NAD+ kinase